MIINRVSFSWKLTCDFIMDVCFIYLTPKRKRTKSDLTCLEQIIGLLYWIWNGVAKQPISGLVQGNHDGFYGTSVQPTPTFQVKYWCYQCPASFFWHNCNCVTASVSTSRVLHPHQFKGEGEDWNAICSKHTKSTACKEHINISHS